MTSTDATQAVMALWWLVLIRGVLAVLFGLYALFSPAAALLALAQLHGQLPARYVIDGDGRGHEPSASETRRIAI